MNSKPREYSRSIVQGAFIALLLASSLLYCKPTAEDTDLAFWAVVAFAREAGITKPGSVNDCVDQENCPNQTEGDFTSKSSGQSAGGKDGGDQDKITPRYSGSCNVPSVSLCVNLPSFGKTAEFCERADGQLSLEKCSPDQGQGLAGVGTCLFKRGQAVFYAPLYSAQNGPELCSKVYSGLYSPGYKP